MHKNDKIRYVQNKIKVMSAFSSCHTFSDLRDKLSLSEPTLTKHISRMVTAGELEKEGRNYRLTEKGIGNLVFLKSEVRDLGRSWKMTTNNSLLRYTITPANGRFKSVQFSGIMESWQSPETEIPQSTVDNAMRALIDLLKIDGSGTMKLSLEIRFGATVAY